MPNATRAEGRKGRRRAGIGIADQLLYSLTNFALTVVVARAVSVAEFGTYSLIIATYLIGMSVIRGLTAETLVVRFSAASREAWRRATGDAGGASLVCGLVFGVALISAGLFLHGSMRSALLTFGVLIPGLIIQDFLRFAALALGRPALALANDATQAVTQVALLAALLALGTDEVWLFVGAWGIAAWAAAVVGAIGLRLAIRPLGAVRWFREQFDMAGRYALDDLASQTSQQGTAYAVAAVGGLSDAGALRGAQTAFGPPSILNLGILVAVTPEMVRIKERSSRKLRTFAMRLGLILGALGLAWGLMVLAVPDSLGRQAFGATWTAAHPLLLYFVVAQTASGIRVAPMAGLRSLGAANRTLLARSIVIGAGLVFQVAGAIADGARGAAIANAIVSPLQAAAWWWQFEVALRDHRRRTTQRRISARWNALVESAPPTATMYEHVLRPWPE